MISYTNIFHQNMHNTTAITTGSANQRPNTLCIRLWIDVTFRALEDSYSLICRSCEEQDRRQFHMIGSFPYSKLRGYNCENTFYF